VGEMKRQATISPLALLLLLLSPFIFLVAFFAFVERVNPVKAHIYQLGTIDSQYAGGPKAGNFTFAVRLQGGREVDVRQREGEQRLAIGTRICVRIAVRKRTEWTATERVPLEECGQDP
jgi:hypothetical protein